MAVAVERTTAITETVESRNTTPQTKLNFHEIKSNLNNTIRLPKGRGTSKDNKQRRRRQGQQQDEKP